MPQKRFGRVVKFRMALSPSTFASAVARGTAARFGKAAKTAGVWMTGLIVHGMSGSFWLMRVNVRAPFITVRGWSLYIPNAVKEFSMLLGGTDIRPRAGPLPFGWA